MKFFILFILIGIVAYAFLKSFSKKSTYVLSHRDSSATILTEKLSTSTVSKDLTFSRAKEGTYDKSYFIDPQTNRFRFPNYNIDNKRFIVKITDETEYKTLYWEDFTPKEKQEYTIKHFEFSFIDPDIYIHDSFWEIFDKPMFKQLSQYQYLYGHGWDLESLMEEMQETSPEDFEVGFYLDLKFGSKLLKNGLISQVELTEEEKEKLSLLEMERRTVAELKNLAEENGLEIKNVDKKEDLINTIRNNIQIQKLFPPPISGKPNDNFFQLMEHLYNLYIEDIKSHIDHWHPLYIGYVWKGVESECDCEPVREKIKKIIESKYWENRLYAEKI